MGWWRRRRLSLALMPRSRQRDLRERAVPSGGQWEALPSCRGWRQGCYWMPCGWVAASGGKYVGKHRPSALGSPLAHRTASPPPERHWLLPTFPSSIAAPTLPHVLSACPRQTLLGHFHLRAFAQAVCSAWSVFPSKASPTSRPAAGPLPRETLSPSPTALSLPRGT